MTHDTEPASLARHGHRLLIVAIALFAVAGVKFASRRHSHAYDAGE